MEAVRGEVELSGEVVELYIHVGIDYVRLDGDGGMPLCFWTFVSLAFVPAGFGEEEGWWGRGRQRGGPHLVCGAEDGESGRYS